MNTSHNLATRCLQLRQFYCLIRRFAIALAMIAFLVPPPTVMAGEVGTAPNTGVLESGSVRPVPQLILKNVLHQVPDDPLYLKQLEVLKTAVRSGYRLHVYMKRSDGTEYFTDLIACRIMGDRISAVLPMRPFINGNAEASASNGFFGGSVDTLGTYIWAPYRIGADTLGLRANDKAFQAKIERGDYEISWYIY